MTALTPIAQVQAGSAEAVYEGIVSINQGLIESRSQGLPLSAVHDRPGEQTSVLCGVPGMCARGT